MTWTLKGERLIDEKDFAKAVKCFDEALRLNPKIDSIWVGRGIALSKQGLYSNASSYPN